ncbi:MAG: chorismate mutase [Alphaproteobacteria bacterium]|nr:chorismate mutase [Alphaproteobacteria bacterium]
MERAPIPCPEMTDIRTRIDALDKRLVAMLVERQALIKEAGRVKPDRHQIRDEARIEEVIALVQAEAQAQGLSPRLAEAVWRQLIEQSIAYEYDVFDTRAEK